MKVLFTSFLLFISLAVLSQANKKPTSSGQLVDTNKVLHQDFTEGQMLNLYTLLKISGESELIWDSQSVTTHAARVISKFADSLMSVYSDQSYRWHPMPPQVKSSLDNFEDSLNKIKADSVKLKNK